jgi:hypothetical protein
MALMPEIRITAARLREDTELPDELYFEPRLLEELALHRVLDRLSGLDSTTGHDSGVGGLVDGVEDEQLVGPGDRLLTRDVGDDSGPDDQLDWARIFALWARLAAW